MTEKGDFWRIPAPSREDLRKFGLVMAVGLGLFTLFCWYKDHQTATRVLGGSAGFFLVTRQLFPLLAKPFYLVWMLLARILGFVNTHVLLALIFYTLFTVIGVVMRLFGRDPMERKLDPEQKSYWSRKSPSLLAREHYERQF